MTPSVTSDRSAKWRFESLDVRAGLAFAAWRGERGPASASGVEECPCLFFGPPDFSPETVGSIAFAMSAARGSFQPGLSIEGREATFNTPEEVAEFVRRAYVGSAGGDGGDGNDDGGLPTPPVDPRDLPKIEDAEHDGNFWNEQFANGALHQDAERFGLTSKKTEFGNSSECTWTDLRGRNGVVPMASAALQILRELLRRAPFGDPKNIDQWHGALKLFGGCLARTGLWPEVLTGHFGSMFQRLMNSFSIPVQMPRDLDPYEKATLLFGSDPTLDDEAGIRLVLDYRYFLRHLGLAGSPITHITSEDPMELLRRLPLPEHATSMAASDLKHRASLYHALSSFIAAPQPVPSIDIVLFASACVVTCHAPPVAGPLYGPREVTSSKPTPLQRSAVQRVAEEAFDWLREHLPRAVYSPGYEQVFVSAKEIRYW